MAWLVPIPGTPLEPEPEADKVLPCLRHWADIARAMHSPTWTMWEQETREVLSEYSKRTGTEKKTGTIEVHLDRNIQKSYNKSVQAE